VSALAISVVVFACVFGGALLGMLLRAALPEHHLSEGSKDAVKLGMGLIATMAALVLDLLIAAATTSYNTRSSELTQMAANIILFDRVLAHYGPETKEARDLLRRAVALAINRIWPENSTRPATLDPTAAWAEGLYDKIQELSPQNDTQRWLQSQALTMNTGLGQTRWLLFEQRGSSIPTPFLVVLVFWLTILFICFGLVAPPNAPHRYPVRLRALGFRCDLPDPRAGPPVRGAHSNLQRPPT
jgi:hypothetical protein